MDMSHDARIVLQRDNKIAKVRVQQSVIGYKYDFVLLIDIKYERVRVSSRVR